MNGGVQFDICLKKVGQTDHPSLGVLYPTSLVAARSHAMVHAMVHTNVTLYVHMVY